MSRFAERRNIYAEEQVILMELQDLLDAREIPKDPIRRAQFWADYYSGEGNATERLGRTVPSLGTSQGAPVPGPRHLQPSLFPELEAA